MIRGHFDLILGRDICGWAWDSSRPERALSVEVLLDEKKIAEGQANLHRPDLLNAGIGGGNHAFSIPLPLTYTHGGKADLLLRVDTEHILQGTPVVVTLPDLRFHPAPLPLTVPPIMLGLCAIVKNEAPYLLEWIAHHRLVGIGHFLIFDNESTDGGTDILSMLARAGVVEHVPWPGKTGNPQRDAYAAGVERLRGRCRWTAFIDADEFLTPLGVESLTDIVADFNEAAGLMVPWRLYGSGGQMKAGKDLVTRRFTRRAPTNHRLNGQVKTIVQTHLVATPGIHTPTLTAGCLIDEYWRVGGSMGNPDNHTVPDAKRLVINHYFTKSKEEWQRKKQRGRASQPVGSIAWQRPDDHFTRHDLNDEEDLLLSNRSDSLEKEITYLRQLIGLDYF